MRTRYSTAQIAIHWLVFVLVLLTYTSVALKENVVTDSAVRGLLTRTHYSLGFCVLFFMCVRLFVRAMYTTPPVKPLPARGQRYLSIAIHVIIYLIFIGMPLVGILSEYYGGHEWTMFSVNMPKSVFPDVPLETQLITLHGWLANTGYYLIGLHAFIALWHHYRRRDNSLIRMMPGGK